MGWTHVTLDDCWGGKRLANGSYWWDPLRFPAGIPALADHIHKLGRSTRSAQELGQDEGERARGREAERWGEGERARG